MSQYWIILVLFLHLAAGEGPIVQLKNNFTIQGKRILADSGIPFNQYLGIPYAKPPIGQLRFQPPQPYEWTNNIDALNEPNVCTQVEVVERKGLIGNEDCLYLNVYTPVTNISTPLPVIVWIHGGALYWGSSQLNMYTPDYLIENNVIVVSIQYRLGVLGFLNIGECSISGNMGLKDQVMALKWIQSHIQSFGGDPDLVTIFGESAGASSVHLLLLSSSANGLFSRVIAHSGSALNSWTWTQFPKEEALRYVSFLNYSEEVHGNLTEFLLSFDAKELVQVSIDSLKIENKALGFYRIFPSAEDPKCKDVFMTEHPIQLMKQNNRENNNNKIPILMGTNQNEGILLTSVAMIYSENNNLSFYENMKKNYSVVPERLRIINNLNCNETYKIWDEILNFYLGNKNVYTSEDDNKFVQLIGDGYFTYDAWQAADIESKKRNIFLYYFTARGPTGVFTFLNKLNGINHGDELGYIFSGSLYNKCYSRGGEYQECQAKSLILSKQICKAWATFASTGVPRNDWLSYKQCGKSPCYMNIGSEWRMESGDPIKNRTNFWKNLYKNQ